MQLIETPKAGERRDHEMLVVDGLTGRDRPAPPLMACRHTRAT